MFALTLKNIAAHKMRLLSTAFAVLLGVAFMAGALVFNDTLVSNFDHLVADANGGVDGVVRAQSPVERGFGQSGARVERGLVDEVAAVDGVDRADFLVFGYAQLIGPDGSPVGDQDQAPAFGLNWVANRDMNPYELAAGSAPRADDEIVIDRRSARETGYGPGDVVTVLTGDAPRQFRVSGVATFAGRDSAAGSTAILFDDATALDLLSPDGGVDWVVMTAEPGVSQHALVDAVDGALDGDGLEVVTGDDLVAEGQRSFHDQLQPFKVFMLVFAFVALFVGSFIINNTFSITVAQRSKENAMLRAIGASRRQVLRSVLLEALVIGVVASVAGALVGIAVARVLVALMGGLGLDLPGTLVVSRGSILAAIGLGLVVTVVSAVLPARRGSRVQPIAALRDVALDRAGTSRGRAVAGGVLGAFGLLALFAGLGSSEIALVGLGAMLVLVAAAVLAPIFTRPVTAVLGRPLAWTGVSGEMATRNAQRSAKRTARTASALMIGVALVSFITIVGASIKSSFADALEHDYHGTHVVDSGAWDGRGGISHELAATLRATPGIDVVSASRMTPAVVAGTSREQFAAFDATTIGTLFDLGEVDGDLRSLGADGIAVSRDQMESRDWRRGSTVTVGLPTGEHEFVVRAVYEDATWVGPEFVSTEALDLYMPAQLDFRVYVAGDDAAVRSATAPYGDIDVLDRKEFSDSVSAEIDEMLGLVYALLALAIVISLFGVANTMALSVHERTRELGLLRAVGMSRRQVRATVRGEAAMIGVLGTTLGIAIGVFFGWAAMRALADQGFDVLTIPAPNLAVIAAFGAIAAAVAAGLPARRAARLDVLHALSAQ